MTNIRKLLAMLLALVLVFGLVACASSDTTTPADTSSDSSSEDASDDTTPDSDAAESGNIEYDVVFIPKSIHEFYNIIRTGVDDAIADLAEEGITINLTWSAAAKADSSEQARLLESAISLQPDAIAIAVIDGDMCKDLMQQALDMGISVIAFDTDFEGSPRQACVGAGMDNQRLCGSQAVDMLVEGMGTDSAQIAVLSGSPTAENHQIILEGFTERVEADFPNLEIVTIQADNDDLETATRITENIFAQYPDIQGIFGVTSSNGLGACKAYQAAIASGQFELGDVTIIDKTLTEEKRTDMIPTGYMYGVLDSPPYIMGYYAVQMINAYLTDGIPYQDIEMPYREATAENLDTFTDNYLEEFADLEYWNQ